ncbi:hypothetical protein GCM10027275_03630 [Rhabdobacter roseus]|uniref:Putative acyltransferase n=1 Tax=Rhabdobacter roseus TaxID=1655419 RepID=A0A840TLZ3_9BACT|nr:DUF5009 domain-containing protein [Rhabdobacter roseus]MBB5282253.1 putative acyltransferase [Rhabdobacter roseus]
MAPSPRIASIDVFRALTMFLMIFVNDLWTLREVPTWLEHSAAQDDAMGLADVVFPAFLFIVGLSIPFAIAARSAQGEGTFTLLRHIGARTWALLLMGLFIVNLESTNGAGMVLSKYLWQLLMVLGFFLIWNVYPAGKKYLALKVLGYLLLLGLAVVYRGGDASQTTWMQTHWWGILGLIGWSYLLCALVYVLFGDQLVPILLAWLFFLGFNLADFAGTLSFLDGVKKYVWIVGSGSMPAFAMAGVVASVIYRRYAGVLTPYQFLSILLGLGALCLLVGFGLRPFWGISKIRATPAWVGICSGVSFGAYALLFWVVDVQKRQAWAKVLRPAGVATLTCYLVPYIWYAVITLVGLALPMYLRTGLVGILKSLIFSLVMIVLTGGLLKVGVRLKV